MNFITADNLAIEGCRRLLSRWIVDLANTMITIVGNFGRSPDTKPFTRRKIGDIADRAELGLGSRR